jgi:hypothetical protein
MESNEIKGTKVTLFRENPRTFRLQLQLIPSLEREGTSATSAHQSAVAAPQLDGRLQSPLVAAIPIAEL